MAKRNPELANTKLKSEEKSVDDFVAWVKGVETKLVDKELKLGEEIISKSVEWAHKVEQSLGLDHYYIDSLEIDLGVSAPGTFLGKLTIKNKTGQSTSYPRP